MRSILSPGTKCLQLRSRIGCGADIGAERCGIVDDQFAAAVLEIDFRSRAGGRGDFKRGAAAELEEAGAAWINGRRHVERAGDADRAVVQDGWGNIRTIERPGRAGIDGKDLEVVERAGAHAADRAGAAGELQRVGAAAADNLADEHGAGVDHEPIGGAAREVDGIGPAGDRAGVGHRAGTAGEEDAEGAPRDGRAGEVRDAAAALEIGAGASRRADAAGIAERRGTFPAQRRRRAGP